MPGSKVALTAGTWAGTDASITWLWSIAPVKESDEDLADERDPQRLILIRRLLTERIVSFQVRSTNKGQVNPVI